MSSLGLVTMTSTTTSVLWLRRDLRLGDHPALRAAVDAGPAGVVMLFVLDPGLWRGAGAVRRGWLAASLEALSDDLDGRLVVRLGDPAQVVPAVALEVGASSVHLTSESTPFGAARDQGVQRAVTLGTGAVWRETGTPYAVGPGEVRTRQGGRYQVFTPYYRAWREHGWDEPAARPSAVPLLTLDHDPEALRLLREARRAEGMPALPQPGERAALAGWATFVDDGLDSYPRDRDFPARHGTSRLSAYLKVGAVHPRTLLHELRESDSPGAAAFERQLAWREFYADVLADRPDSAWGDLRPTLAGLRYQEPEDAIMAWQQGWTGFPVVDAAMRQLLATGWMHNRMRMLAASFLTKDLHVWWPVGARWFLERLADGDVASNNHGWQWVAGTGTDASPYERVFNPVLQGERFDPDGEYVRCWVPELAHLPGGTVHRPWEHPDGYLHGYPRRIVDHAEERREALARYRTARG